MGNINKKPLYRFKLNEATGEITTSVITDYILCGPQGYRYYRFTINGTKYYAYESKLDKFSHWTVYSLDSDINKATQIMREAISDKYSKLYDEAQRYYKVLNKIDLLWR